jgi:hypothetical protein
MNSHAQRRAEMKIFAVGFVLIIFICGASISSAGASAPYVRGEAIRNWIETPKGMPKGHWKPEGSSFIEKGIIRSGDSLARGVVHAYSYKALLDPDRLDRVLTLIRLSFSEPDHIQLKENKNPADTMRLLFALEQDCKDLKLKDKIIDTERYVFSQLAKSLASGKPE